MSSKAKKLPCINCRQQKARCDIDLASGKPCSRCDRLKQVCQTSSEYKRQTKRRRADGESSQHTVNAQSVDSGFGEELINGSHDGSLTPGAHYELSTRPASSHARLLDGIEVPPRVVEETFSVFFNRYHDFMPILERTKEPQEYYESSQFLYWTILAIGGRSSKHTVLTYDIPRKVNDLAVESMKYREEYLESIRGLLLLLTWPVSAGCPADHFAFAGAAVHMAMAIGLHVPISSQDFAASKITLTEAEVNERAELWTHCLVAHGRMCSIKGIAAMTGHAIGSDPDALSTIDARLSSRLAFSSRLHRIVMRCSLAMQKNGLRILSADQERALGILIRVFSDQLDEMAREINSDYESFVHAVAQLQCQSFLFFKMHEPIDVESLVSLNTICCRIIRLATSLDEADGFLPVAPIYHRFGILVAACVLLRLLKSPFSKYLTSESTQCFQCAVDMASRLSRTAGDTPHRYATALSQLWGSTKAFRKTDGSEYLGLRLRTRLTMSVVLDASWWWKAEFQSGPEPRKDRLDTGAHDTTAMLPSHPTEEGPQSTAFDDRWLDSNDGSQDLNIFNDPLLAQFGFGTQFENDLFIGWPQMCYDFGHQYTT